MQEEFGGMRRAAMLACWLSLLVLAGLHSAAAAELRKCALPNGRAAYVSDACPSGSREIWQRAVASDPRHEAELKRRQQALHQWQQASRRQAASRQRPYSTGANGGRSVSTAATRCERARQRRDRIRDKDWMRMTYDRMIRLDDEVAEACR